MSRQFISVLVALSLSFSALIPGCGGDDGKDAEAGTPTLSGVYQPVDPGAIDSITFSDTEEYALVPSGCGDGDCAEVGTYRLDAANKVVVLEDYATDQTRSLPLEVLETTSATPSPATGVATLDLVGSGQKLATSGNVLTRPITRLVLAGQRLTQIAPAGTSAGPCAGTPIALAVKCVERKGARVLSFYRSPADQQRVRRENGCTNKCSGMAGCVRPTAGCNTSPHTRCRAVDLVGDGAPLTRAELKFCGFSKRTQPHANHYDFGN